MLADIKEQELLILSNIKRFFEKWDADPDFRKQVVTDSTQAVSRYKLNINPEEIRPLWDTGRKASCFFGVRNLSKIFCSN
jgi:hypothetical protein